MKPAAGLSGFFQANAGNALPANAFLNHGQQPGQNQATIGVYSARFSNLTPHQQDALRKIENEFRKPMKDHLREIGAADTKHYELENKLVEMKVDTMKLLNEQNELKGKMSKLLEHVKYSYSDCESHGEQQMQRIAKREESRAYGKDLPNAYFHNHLAFLVNRLSDVATKIESFDKLMHSVRRSLSGRIEENKLNSVSTGGLERRRYIGTKDIQKMMKLQNDAFNSLSTTIAELHQGAGDIRRSYLAKKREEHPNETIQNPFDAEDKKQQTEEEYRSHTIQKQISEYYKHQNKPLQVIANAVPGPIMGDPKPDFLKSGAKPGGFGGFGGFGGVPPAPLNNTTNIKSPAGTTSKFGGLGTSPSTQQPKSGSGFGNFPSTTSTPGFPGQSTQPPAPKFGFKTGQSTQSTQSTAAPKFGFPTSGQSTQQPKSGSGFGNFPSTTTSTPGFPGQSTPQQRKPSGFKQTGPYNFTFPKK